MEIVELLALLILYWRLGLATALSLAIAVALAKNVEWVTGLHGIFLVLVGVAIGLLWEGDAAKPASASPGEAESKWSWPVLALALWFFGALIGTWATVITGSKIAGAALLIGGLLTVYVYRLRAGQQRMTVGRFWLAAASLLVGLGTVLGAGMVRAQRLPNPASELTAQSWPRQAGLLFSSRRGQLRSAAQRRR